MLGQVRCGVARSLDTLVLLSWDSDVKLDVPAAHSDPLAVCDMLPQSRTWLGVARDEGLVPAELVVEFVLAKKASAMCGS